MSRLCSCGGALKQSSDRQGDILACTSCGRRGYRYFGDTAWHDGGAESVKTRVPPPNNRLTPSLLTPCDSEP